MHLLYFLKTNICENFMEMLLYELWLSLVVKHWIAHSGTCSWVLALRSPDPAPLPGVLAPRVPLSCVFLILLMFF